MNAAHGSSRSSIATTTSSAPASSTRRTTRSSGRPRGRSRSSITSSRRAARPSPSQATRSRSSSQTSISAARSGPAPGSPPRSSSTRRTGVSSSGRSSAIRTTGWARTVFGEPDVERLWDAVDHRRPPGTSPTPVYRVARPHRSACFRRRAASLERASHRRTPVSPVQAPTFAVGLCDVVTYWLTGARGDGRRHSAHVKRPDRGGLHHTAPPSEWPGRFARRSRSPSAWTIVRGLDLRIEDGRVVDVRAEDRRRRRARGDGDPTRARASWARSLSSTATRACGKTGDRLPTTRCSTRTPRAISPGGRASRRLSTAARTDRRRSSPSAATTTRSSTRTS